MVRKRKTITNITSYQYNVGVPDIGLQNELMCQPSQRSVGQQATGPQEM